MNLEELKDIINQYKDKLLLNSKTPWQFKQNQNLFKEISNKYNNLFKNTMEVIYLIRNYDNLENLYIFCKCGKKNNFGNINKGYTKYCCKKCMTNDKQYQEKLKLSKLNNIDENGLNSYQRMIIKLKQTKKEKYNDENYNNKEKRKQTFKERYNSTSSFNSKELRKKAKQTMLNDIDKNGLNKLQRKAIKAIQTKKNTIDEHGLNIIQKYIKKTVNTKLNDIDENGLNSYQRAIIKARKTCIKKYNVNHYTKTAKFKKYIQQNTYFKSQQFKDLFKNKNWLNKIKQKEYETKKKNNSFNKSEQEDKIYNYLLQKFNKDDIKRQYRSEEYSFTSDFYIKTLDLYIEYHGTWTHGNKPFKHSVEDLEKLQKLKQKSEEINFKGKKKDYYKNVIYTWTKLDPLKLQTFKKNKLNYKIFYKIEQFLNWYNKI